MFKISKNRVFVFIREGCQIYFLSNKKVTKKTFIYLKSNLFLFFRKTTQQSQSLDSPSPTKKSNF